MFKVGDRFVNSSNQYCLIKTIDTGIIIEWVKSDYQVKYSFEEMNAFIESKIWKHITDPIDLICELI